MTVIPCQYPEDFLWGCASSAYQIEGAADVDARGPSNWDAFCALPGRTKNGDSGRIACDHYRRYREDVALMAGIGVKAYRFSIAWPRVVPNGSGEVNEKGLDFYERLVDELLKHNIRPIATCYHWDMPLAREIAGGWLTRDTVKLFADYCGILAKRLGDRIPTWCTLNEPDVVITAGYRHGAHPPGKPHSEKEVRQVAHHLLLAHGLGMQALRASSPKPLEVGLVHNSVSFNPMSEDAADVDATREVFRRRNGWLLQPACKGSYPEDLWKELGADVPDMEDGDLQAISAKTEYLGLNTYFAENLVSAKDGARPFETWYPRTQMGWPFTPEVLYWTTRFTHELYAPGRMMITENGCSFPDEVKEVNGEGAVEDFARVLYYREHLRGLHRSLREGIPITGYMAWSVMDNFEWTAGYGQRFGLIHVNYETQKRTPKASAHWYSKVIKTGRV
jgi:beta-glucosidase